MLKVVFIENPDAEEEHLGWKQRLKRYPELIIIIIAVIIMILLMGRLGIVQFDRAVAIGFMLIFLAVMIRLSDWSFKHFSYKVVFERGYSTYSGHIHEVGNFGLIRLDGYSTPLPHEGGGGAVIFPIDAITRVGRSASVLVTTFQVQKEQLPILVKKYIDEQRIPPPYKYGIASETQLLQEGKSPAKTGEHNLPDIEKYEKMIVMDMQRNEFVNMLDDIARGKLTSIEKATAKYSVIASKSQRGGLRETLKKALYEEEKER